MRIYPLLAFLCLHFTFSNAAFCSETPESITLDVRVLLQGALFKADLSYADLMRDDLRANAYLPLEEPYSGLNTFHHAGSGGGEVITEVTVLKVSGENAIVDWVFLELRSETDAKKVVATRSALLCRNGTVVDLDGVSPVKFESVFAGYYYVAVRHRNHFGAMSQAPLSLSSKPRLVDFTDPSFPVFGLNAQKSLDTRRALWGGDINQDGKSAIHGYSNDIDMLFFAVVVAEGNTGLAINFIVPGYLNTDVNLDGRTTYSGPNSDHAVMISGIYLPWNTYCTANMPDHDCSLEERLPR